MSVDELLAKANATVVDDDMIAAMQARLEAAEKSFEEEALSKSVDEDYLSRGYSL